MKSESRQGMPNKPRADVRYHAARAARSRRALLDALAELLHEQSFGKITVQDLLRRAHVGRATFYAHFQDKDDLLLTSFVRMLEAMTRQLDAEPPGSPRWVPVTEFFEHVRSARPLLQMFEESGRLPIMWRLATLHFARSIEPRAGSAFVARFLAGALIEVLQWWLEAREPPAARTVERDFHALAHAVVRSAR